MKIHIDIELKQGSRVETGLGAMLALIKMFHEVIQNPAATPLNDDDDYHSITVMVVEPSHGPPPF